MPTNPNWTEKEDESLRLLVAQEGAKKWSLIASKLKTKGSKQCRRRWKNYLNADLKQGGWTLEEDRILIDGHKRFGNRWTEIAKMVGGRTDNAVKNRWAALCKRTQKIRGGGTVTARGAGSRRARVIDEEDSEEDSEEEHHHHNSSAGRNQRPHSTSPSARSSPRLTAASAAVAVAAGHIPAALARVTATVEAAWRANGSATKRVPQQLQGPDWNDTTEPDSKRRRSTGPVNQLVAPVNQLVAPVNVPTFSLPNHTSRLSGIPSPRSLHNALPPRGVPGVAAASQQMGRGSPAVDISPPSSSSPRGKKARPELKLLIPNPSADPPAGSANHNSLGLGIHVLKDLLSPTELQYASELNEMDCPLQITLNDPMMDPPLSTSRRAAQDAMSALMEGSPTGFGPMSLGLGLPSCLSMGPLSAIGLMPLTATGTGGGGGVIPNAPLPSTTATATGGTGDDLPQFDDLRQWFHGAFSPLSVRGGGAARGGPWSNGLTPGPGPSPRPPLRAGTRLADAYQAQHTTVPISAAAPVTRQADAYQSQQSAHAPTNGAGTRQTGMYQLQQATHAPQLVQQQAQFSAAVSATGRKAPNPRGGSMNMQWGASSLPAVPISMAAGSLHDGHRQLLVRLLEHAKKNAEDLQQELARAAATNSTPRDLMLIRQQAMQPPEQPHRKQEPSPLTSPRNPSSVPQTQPEVHPFPALPSVRSTRSRSVAGTDPKDPPPPGEAQPDAESGSKPPLHPGPAGGLHLTGLTQGTGGLLSPQMNSHGQNSLNGLFTSGPPSSNTWRGLDVMLTPALSTMDIAMLLDGLPSAR